MTMQRTGPLSTVSIAIISLLCASSVQNNTVQTLSADPYAIDGNEVRVTGIVVMQHGLANLYSEDRQECVGLLITDGQRPMFAAQDNQTVDVIGTMWAEGCGREGICDEHLCGPAVLRDVSIDQTIPD